MKIIRALFFLIIILFFVQKVPAQSFSLKHYTVEDGLNTSSVYYATQDFNGNMWFATEQGVCKFDGRTFTRYTINDGLSDNEVLFIKTDSKGRIWFLTLNGHISFYRDGKFCNESNTPWLKKTFIGAGYNGCFQNSQGTIFLGALGMKFVTVKRDSIVDVMSMKLLAMGYSYFENNDKSVSIYKADGGYLLFDDKIITEATLQHHCCRANCISFMKNSQFYFSTEGITKKTGKDEKVILPINEMYPSETITGVTETKDSSFIITSRKGVLWYPPGVFTLNKARVLLEGKTVLSFFIDAEGNFWFCTQGDGIYLLAANQMNYLNYTSSNGLGNEVVNRVTKDEKGNIWLACNRSTVSRIGSNGIQNFILNKAYMANGRALDLAIDSSGNVYAGTDEGVYELNTHGIQEEISLLRSDGIKNKVVTKNIHRNPDNSITVTYSYGVLSLQTIADTKEKVFSAIHLLPEDSEIRTYTHYFDKQGRLWVADIHGFALWNNNRLNYYADKDSLLSKRISNIIETADSTLVLSTEGYGILFFKNGKIINRFNETNGLSSNVCRRLFIRGNTLWISTFQGLTKCTYKNNDISDIHIFNVNNGLLSNSVKDVFDDGEKVYVATEKGLCIMGNVSQETTSSPPPLSIIEIDYAGLKSTMTDTAFQFKTNNSFKINFAAVTFQNPREVKYRYRIPKLNSAWIETKNNSVEYSLIGSGKYDFEVQAKKVNSNWSKTASVSFIMIPPFYKTTWFYIFIISVAGFFIYYVTRFITQQRFQKQLAIARQNEMIEHERMRIASDMHDDIGADLTQISIWSNILKTTTQNEVVNKIVSSSNDVLQKVDSIIWALDSVHDHAEDLISYLRNYALNYLESSDMSLHFETSQTLPEIKLSATQRRNIYLVFKELLHNTVKHSEASKVEVRVFYTSPYLILNYSDNGKGFDTAILGEGLGFTTLKQRMADIDSTFNFTSEPGKRFIAELNIKV